MNPHPFTFSLSWLLLLGFAISPGAPAAEPLVSSVRASQRAYTELVDIFYDLTGPDTGMGVTVLIFDGGTHLPAETLSGAIGNGIQPGVNKHIVWDAGKDWDGQFSTRCRVRISATDPGASPGFNLIAGGAVEIGEASPGEGWLNERPVHTVYVSGFHVERTEVTKGLWDKVYNWAITHGYSLAHQGAGKGPDHPVHRVSWYDAVKWCNARSEWQGLTPVYYTDANQSTVYRSGEINLAGANVKWSANGYRLPTEAEWEKAARGGLAGRRFPWGDTITHHQANYYSTTDIDWDTSPTRGYHPTYSSRRTPEPWTSPVASFAPNGYGLYDMAGNVWELCWDWFDESWYANPDATKNDPRGPGPGQKRVFRGGSYGGSSFYTRCAYREGIFPSDFGMVGFRCVRTQ